MRATRPRVGPNMKLKENVTPLRKRNKKIGGSRSLVAYGDDDAGGVGGDVEALPERDAAADVEANGPVRPVVT